MARRQSPLSTDPIRAVLTKIVSGGQTGVDRAAHDAALAAGYPIGGWAPRGFIDETGTIPFVYRPYMQEHRGGYTARTKANVQDTDATLLITLGQITPGTLQTADFAFDLGKPVTEVNLGDRLDRLKPFVEVVDAVQAFILQYRPVVLNVAGPRESRRPGVHATASSVLWEALR